jgi:hypothetical protein
MAEEKYKKNDKLCIDIEGMCSEDCGDEKEEPEPE